MDAAGWAGVVMVLDFAFLPPEINSGRIFAGAGSGPLFMAASAWEALAADLRASASSFDSVIAGLASGAWMGPASVAMAAAGAPYVGWLSAAAGQAELSAAQARAAAGVFEAALTATVHPAAVEANRVLLGALAATNILGQNTPAIAATEFDYVEMWAQDVAAMVGYLTGSTSVASTLAPFSVPPVNLAGLASDLGAQVTGAALAASSAVAPVAEEAVVGAQAVAAAVPADAVLAAGQGVLGPAMMALQPMMSLFQLGQGTGVAGAEAGLLGADAAPLLAGEVDPVKGLGGAGGLGSAASAGLGKARLVGAMSVPPSWQGAAPTGAPTTAMSGFGAMPAGMAEGVGMGGRPMGMMPMPMGMGGAGAGMPGGMGRGGAASHVVQARPSVVPRTGIG